MPRFGFPRVLALLAFLFAAHSLAHAAVGRCTNQQINQAFTAMTMVPNGSGAGGDCNPTNYGAGSWTSLQDLEVRVVHSRDCSDPWLGQIYWYTYNRRPNATECNKSNYGGGSWSSYMDLANKVKTYQSGLIANNRPSSYSSPGTPQIASSAISRSTVSGNNSGPKIATPATTAQGGNIVAQGGGNIVAQGGGNIVAQGGGNATSYSLQSVSAKPRAPNGKYMVAPTGDLVDSNGNTQRRAGSYLLTMKNGGYVVAASGGTVRPSSGMVVNLY
ncbi:MAG TPA: hypothetical protein VGN16_04485 [Acidobacteriaceae bacterium]|jgi:hypothetical protein